MKIITPGTVCIGPAGESIQIEGFLMSPEEKDMPFLHDSEAFNSIYAETAVKWALQRLQDEVTKASTIVIQNMVKGRKQS